MSGAALFFPALAIWWTLDSIRSHLKRIADQSERIADELQAQRTGMLP